MRMKKEHNARLEANGDTNHTKPNDTSTTTTTTTTDTRHSPRRAALTPSQLSQAPATPQLRETLRAQADATALRLKDCVCA